MRMTTVLVSALLALATACSVERPASVAAADDPEPAPAAAAAQPADEVPPDGPELFAFMKEKIPTLAAKVPCSCCPFSIGQCYDGACPTSCGPCNQIGRDAYHMHAQGMADDEVVARIREKYGITR